MGPFPIFRLAGRCATSWDAHSKFRTDLARARHFASFFPTALNCRVRREVILSPKWCMETHPTPVVRLHNPRSIGVGESTTRAKPIKTRDLLPSFTHSHSCCTTWNSHCTLRRKPGALAV